MLKFFRKKRNLKIILWGTTIVIVITFVFWGAGSSLRGSKGRPRHAGIIFGKTISIEKYIKSKQQCYYQALMLYGENLPKIIDYLDLDKQAWDRLMLLEEARKKGIETSNDEVIQKIEQIPIFHEDNKFNSKIYKFIVRRYFKTEPRSFEEEMRNNIKLSKLYQDITENITLSEKELEKIYKNKHEKIKVSYILIEPGNFKDEVKIVESELKKYYQDNKKRFKIPPQVNVEYLPITIDLTKDEVRISDEEIKAYYEDNKEYFKLENQTQKNETNNNNKKTQYKPYEQAREDIRHLLINRKSKNKILDIAVEIRHKIKNEATFSQISNEYEIKIKESGFFSKTQSIPEIGWSYNFVNTAFNLEKNKVSDIIELPDGYYILKLKDKKDSYIPTYEQIKDKAEEGYINEKAFLLAKQKIANYQKIIKEKIDKGQTFKEAANELSLKIKTTDFFTRDDYVKGIGQSKEFKDEAFSYKEGGISSAIKAPKGYCILKIEEFKPIDKKKFEEEKEDFRKKCLEEKKTEIFDAWFKNLKEEADLKSFI